MASNKCFFSDSGSAVSGCVRECAEAQGKDFGMIATENGYNLYLGGNGGANPVHAQLFATDIDEDTVLKFLDRYIMYYILTADKLERTAVWQSKLPSGKNGGGPIEHLKEAVVCGSSFVYSLPSRVTSKMTP